MKKGTSFHIKGKHYSIKKTLIPQITQKSNLQRTDRQTNEETNIINIMSLDECVIKG